MNSTSKTEIFIEIVTRLKNIAEQKVEKNIVRPSSIVDTISVIITNLLEFASFRGYKGIFFVGCNKHQSVSHDLEELRCNTMQRQYMTWYNVLQKSKSRDFNGIDCNFSACEDNLNSNFREKVVYPLFIGVVLDNRVCCSEVQTQRGLIFRQQKDFFSVNVSGAKFDKKPPFKLHKTCKVVRRCTRCVG